MEKFYMAIIVREEPVFSDEPELKYARIVEFTSHDDVKMILDRIDGVIVAYMCTTKEEGKELVQAWNESFKQDKKY